MTRFRDFRPRPTSLTVPDMRQTFTLQIKDVLTMVNSDAVGYGPVLNAAIALGKEDLEKALKGKFSSQAGSISTRVARLIRALRTEYDHALEELKTLSESYLVMQPKLDEHDQPIVRNGEVVMEPKPKTTTYKRKDGTTEVLEEKGQFEVKEGYGDAVAALMKSEIEIKGVPFSPAEFDALVIRADIKEGLLPFLDGFADEEQEDESEEPEAATA